MVPPGQELQVSDTTTRHRLEIFNPVDDVQIIQLLKVLKLNDILNEEEFFDDSKQLEVVCLQYRGAWAVVPRSSFAKKC